MICVSIIKSDNFYQLVIRKAKLFFIIRKTQKQWFTKSSKDSFIKNPPIPTGLGPHFLNYTVLMFSSSILLYYDSTNGD